MMRMRGWGLLWVLVSVSAYAADFPAEEVYKKYSPSVVVVYATEGRHGGSIGTGSIIDAQGLVVTNAHVVYEKENERLYSKVGVYLMPAKITGDRQADLSRYYDVEVVHYDVKLDLALLRIKGYDQKLARIELANPDDVNVGQEVVAIGHPEQGGFWTLTYGRVSTVKKDFEGVAGKNVYQTDTSVNRGNSGGPLLDRAGSMIGINSSIARLSQDGLPITGINFSIQSAVVKKWLEDNGVRVAYAMVPLATTPAPVTERAPNTEAEAVTPPKPAAKQPATSSEKKFQTPQHPYDYDELIAAEKDLENMMDEMRRK